MITKEEMRRLHDNLEFEIRLKQREQGDDYDGIGQDFIALYHYKEQLENEKI